MTIELFVAIEGFVSWMAVSGGPMLILFASLPLAIFGRFRWALAAFVVAWGFLAFDWWLVEYLIENGRFQNNTGYENLAPLMGLVFQAAATALAVVIFFVALGVTSARDRKL